MKKYFVIFGAGVLGEKVYAICKSQNKQVVAFVDNDKEKQGTKRMGLDVISCEELTEIDAERSNIVIICTRNSKSRDSIRGQLIQAGYSKENIQNCDLLIEEKIAFEKEEFEKEHPYVLKNVPRREENAKNICKMFENEGIAVIERNIDQNNFADWRDAIGYEKNYKRYAEIFGAAIESKIFQHYMSLQLLDIKPGKTLVDIASSISVFPDIVKKEYSDFVYRQDLCYEKGIHGDKIGSFASDIPLEDSSVDYMTLHCSIEHFEGNEDIGFILNAGKILKPGGKVCIIPLYMAERYYIWTSPEVWFFKYNAYEVRPDLDPEALIVYENEVKQRQSRYYDVGALKKRILSRIEHLFYIHIYFFPNYGQIKGARPFAMILEKK